MSTLPVNTRLQNGAFTIGKVLGKGGFGITYLCGDMNLRRVVAIKEFFPEDCLRQGNSVQPRDSMSAQEYSSAKSKFMEEARTLARFHHPGIVAVHTFFEENNTAYMVMEYLKGKTLAQLIEERGALPEAEAVEHIKKIGEALEELHRSQLLHRDVKPENAIVCEGGRVVLIDFGLTKKVEEVIGLGTRQLAATTRFGSDGFAPPEQYLRSGVLGKYTDVYALGATLYFLLTGTVPESAPERAMGGVLMPPKLVNPHTSIRLSEAVMQAMEIRNDSRTQTVREFLHKLAITPLSNQNRPIPDLITGLDLENDILPITLATKPNPLPSAVAKPANPPIYNRPSMSKSKQDEWIEINVVRPILLVTAMILLLLLCWYLFP